MAEERDLLAANRQRDTAGRSQPAEAAASTNASAPAELTVEQILAWADAHKAAHGAWPAVGPGTVSGMIAGTAGESWKAINHALVFGLRGLPGDSSLAELLAEHRGAPLPDMGPKALAEKIWAWEQEQFPVKGPRLRLTAAPTPDYRLTVEQILAWADAHHAAGGKWPTSSSGTVQGAPFEVTWSSINQALTHGRRGLAGGTTLARVLTENRGRRTVRTPLTVEQILAWADAYHASNGCWPVAEHSPAEAAPGVTWWAIAQALRHGLRGLAGGTSLARLLVEHRGPEASRQAPPLTVEQILDWADAHHATHGEWPIATRAAVLPEAPSEHWQKLDMALRQGHRGLAPGNSLARLLAEHRGVRNLSDTPRLTEAQILAWADAHHAATGKWPTRRSGPIADAPGENWYAIHSALLGGLRGLSGDMTLPRLLADRTPPPKPELTLELILAWADAHHATTGTWPTQYSGRVHAAPLELNWDQVNKALYYGRRGFPGGSSLHLLLAEYRDPGRPLSVEQILAWADAHLAATGEWPSRQSGTINAAPDENWWNLDGALRQGIRGLGVKTTLARILAEHRGVPIAPSPPGLTLKAIVTWADAHYRATGEWPTPSSGRVAASPQHTWSGIATALRFGSQGLPKGLTIASLVARRKPPQERG